MPDPSKIFRIFLSSTFRDLENERDALQNIVFPRLSAICRKSGYSFHAVDLRFGIGENVATEHRTMKVCLEEIARCKKISPQPNFVIMLGERYGWRPLPEEITEGDFDAISLNIENAADKKMVGEWYRLDENAVPPVYCLVPRSGPYQDPAIWREAECELRGIISLAAEKAGLGPEKYRAWNVSATEREIEKGLFESPGAENNSCCFIMNIRAGDDEKALMAAAGYIEPDGESRAFLSELKEKIRKKMRANVFEYEVGSEGGRPSANHLEKFCADAEKVLTWLILERIDAEGVGDESLAESGAHGDFALESSAHFMGRKDLVERIAGYIASGDRSPLLVYAPSGAGKTSLLSKASLEAENRFAGSAVVRRFVGATPKSADPDALVHGIASELARKNGEAPPPGGNGRRHFGESLLQALSRSAASGKKCAVFVDAMDQIFGGGAQAVADMVPAEIPENTKLIISALESDGENGGVLRALKVKIPPENHMPLPQLACSDGLAMLTGWLENRGRKLNEKQLAAVSDRFEKFRMPLYFRLVFERAAGLRSYEELAPGDIGDDIAGVLFKIFDGLKKDHGGEAADACLQAISLSRHGLLEEEIVDIIFSKVFSSEPKKKSSAGDRKGLERGRVSVAWARMRFDLSSFLTERRTRAGVVINSYHRCFDEAVVKYYYRTDSDRYGAHLKMAGFFRERQDQGKRNIDEAAWHLSMANAWPNLFELLSNPSAIRSLWESNRSAARAYWTLVEKKDIYFKMTDAYARILEDPDDNFEYLETISELFYSSGRIAEAAAVTKNLIRICRARNDFSCLARSLIRQASLFENRGEYETAEKLLDECEKVSRDAGLAGELPRIALARERLTIAMRDLKAAAAVTAPGAGVSEAEKAAERSGDPLSMADATREKGRALLLTQNFEEAAAAFAECIRIFSDAGDSGRTAAATHGLATALSGLGKTAEALKNFRESEEILRSLGDKKGIADSLNNQATLYYRSGDLAGALARQRESEAIYSELGDRRGTADAIYNQGLIYYTSGMMKEAEAMYSKCEKIYRELGDDEAIANAIYNLTLILYSAKEYDRALALYEESEKIYRRTGDRGNTANCLADQANIYYHKEKYEAAIDLYIESEKIYRELGDRRSAANNVYNRANILQMRNDYSGAMNLYLQCEKEYNDSGDERGAAGAMYMRARVMLRYTGHAGEALKLAGDALKKAENSGADDLRDKIGNFIDTVRNRSEK